MRATKEKEGNIICKWKKCFEMHNLYFLGTIIFDPVSKKFSLWSLPLLELAIIGGIVFHKHILFSRISPKFGTK